MSTDIFLRTATRALMVEALEAAGLMTTDESGNAIPRQASHGHALDVIGALAGAEGYHANLRLFGPDAETIAAALSTVTIPAPVNPRVVWLE